MNCYGRNVTRFVCKRDSLSLYPFGKYYILVCTLQRTKKPLVFYVGYSTLFVCFESYMRSVSLCADEWYIEEIVFPPTYAQNSIFHAGKCSFHCHIQYALRTFWWRIAIVKTNFSLHLWLYGRFKYTYSYLVLKSLSFICVRYAFQQF